MYVVEYSDGMYLGDDKEITITDTYDRDYFCCQMCYEECLWNDINVSYVDIQEAHNNTVTIKRQTNTFGDFTDIYNCITGYNEICAEMPDYNVYCANCEVLISEGNNE